VKAAEIGRILRQEDLDGSGIGTPSVLKRLKIGQTLSVPQTEARTGIDDAMCYEIPYYGPDGKSLKYSRWKLLNIGHGELGIKYYQDEKTIPHLYFPQIINWKKISQDTSQRIHITEGEKKAACASLMGLPCISIGGVWSFKSKKWSLSNIPDFDWVQWTGREVEVCYDGDMYSNENVSRALSALTAMLASRGARVFIRYLPTTDNVSKMDDYLVKHGVDKFLEDLQCEEADFSRELTSLNERVVYVESMNNYLSLADGKILRDERALDRRMGTTKIKSESGQDIKATTVWASWPHRRTVKDITYAPGRDRYHDGMYNEWRSWGCEPRRGSVKSFLEVVRGIENWEWLLQWMAYPIQNPGAKLLQAVVLWSVETGTGKTFIGKILRHIYGLRNSGEITSTSLHDGRFTWIANKQFVLGEEVSEYSTKMSDYNALKAVITSNTILVDPKFIAPHELPNCANFMFTSNHPDAMRIEKSDRRFFVGELNIQRPQKFWDSFDKWAWSEDGVEKIHEFLLNQVDCSKFNPRERPPMTVAKSAMIYDGMTHTQQWCDILLSDLEQVKRSAHNLSEDVFHPGRDVFTVRELSALMDPDELAKTSEVALSKALTRAGVVRYGGGTTLRVNGKVKRLLAVRNLQYWRENAHDMTKWRANYEGEFEVLNSRKRRAKR